jgi:hypothetical protein
MKIRLIIDGTVVTATLQDNATSRLPFPAAAVTHVAGLRVHQKIGDQPRKLSTQAVPAGSVAAAGDLTYYSPWGNLAIAARERIAGRDDRTARPINANKQHSRS